MHSYRCGATEGEENKLCVCIDTEFQCSPVVWAQPSLSYDQSWSGIPSCIPPLWALLPGRAWNKYLTGQELAPEEWSKLGKQPLPQGNKIQMLGVINPGGAGHTFLLTRIQASFCASSWLFLTGSRVSTPTGGKKNTCPASSWTFSSDQILEFADLQPFPSRDEEYDGKYKTDSRKIPVLSPLCASPSSNQSLEESLGPVGQSIMATTLESHLLSGLCKTFTVLCKTFIVLCLLQYFPALCHVKLCICLITSCREGMVLHSVAPFHWNKLLI